MATDVPSVFSLIQAHILERPHATAIAHGDSELSYGGLGSACRAVASLLGARGVGAGDIVPILTTRCPLAVACVLGVVAVGATWVPMDAEAWSRQRVQTVLETVDHKCLLLTERTDTEWLAALGETVVWVDDGELTGAGRGRASTDSADDAQSQGPRSADDCAYIIFTSGTTGRPKGVAVAHRSLLNYVQSGDAHAPFNMGVRPADAVLLLFSVAFDAYYGVLMSTLCHGGTVVISEPATLPADVKRCTILPVTPTLLGTLPSAAAYPNIRAVFLGGESPSPELIRAWWSPGRKLYNAYGPTEATIAASIAPLSPDAPITLGVPIRHSRMLLLDDALRPCSQGEICIAGPNVAIGYYKDDARTAEKFVRLAEGAGAGERVYRTGDLGQRGADGRVVFLGRRDHVVKNRGFLVNLETEVLPALLAQAGVRSAAAFMHRRRLVAFVAPASACAGPDVLRRAMAGRYDDFVVPDDLRALEALPQTANGKVDLDALAALLKRPGRDREGRGWGEGSASDAATHSSSSTSSRRGHALRDAVADALGMAPPSVDMASSFGDLGGTSLLAIQVLFRLQQAGFTLSLSQLFALPSLAQASECLLEAVSAGGVEATAAAPCGPETSPSRGVMTATQMGIVASTLRDPPRGYMVVRMTLPHRRGDMDALDLEGAWKSVLGRHAVFRASFDLAQGTFDTAPEPAAVAWKRLDVGPDSSCLPQDTVERESRRLIAQAREHALSSDGTTFRPLLALSLLTFAEAESTLLWLVHHAQIDGWSVGALVRDVRETLYGDGGGSPAGSDFAAYANALGPYAHSARGDATRFWSAALDGLLEGTTLKLAPSLEVPARDDPGRRGSQAGSDGGFGAHVLNMGVTLAEAEVNARVYGVSPAVAFYAAWALLLSRYADKDDVVFGTVLSGRNFPLPGGVGGIVGPLINTCPFPVRTRGGGGGATRARSSKSAFLAGVHGQLLAMADHQWSAAEALDQLAPGSHAAMYGTVVFLEYELDGLSRAYPDRQRGGLLGPWRFERQDIPEFQLTLQGQLGAGGQLVFRALFDRTLYADALVARMLSHFRNLYLALMDPRAADVGQVCAAMMGPSEFLTVTRQSPALFEPYAGPATIKDAFEAGLQHWPRAVAIESPTDGMLTYEELDRAANHLARHLNTLLPPRGRRVVAIIGDRSRNWLVGALSIVKAGAVYLPLDSQLPYQRMKVMVETADAVACMYPDRQSLAARLPGVHPRQVVISEVLGQRGTAGPGDAASTAGLPTTSTADEHAYIMFTSGSTGVPKGICVSHRATLSHLAYAPARLHARPGRRHAQMFAPGFDVSIAEVFGALAHGATLVLPDAADPFAHLGRAHAAMLTPSLLAVCAPAELAGLDALYLIGEALPQALADAWCGGGRTVYNAYGPCECTIAALFQRLEPGRPVTLGRAIPRVGVYILDGDRRPVPVGVVGEIYLTGVQVAEGYIGGHMAAASRSVFLDDPFVPGLRMYKTGDAAAWTPALEVQFLGRLDESLVKVRGYRVELDEVALAIRRADSGVRAAVAVVSEDKARVLGFACPATVDTRRVQAALAEALPTYARPAVLMALDRLPTTPNQKLDRKALRRLASQSPGHDRTAGSADGGTRSGTGESTASAPRPCRATAMEKLLCRVWSEVLRLPAEPGPSAEDDFLALGGNSLRQITAAQKVSSALGVRIPLGLFVKNASLRQLAQELDRFRARHGAPPPASFLAFLSAPAAKADAAGQASHLEAELFAMHERSRTPAAFNVAHVLELVGRVDLDILERAVRQVARNSDVLRCCFRRDAQHGQLRRTRHSPQDAEFVVHRWGPDVDCAAKEKELVQEPFDLSRDQLTRIALVETSEWAQSEPISKLFLVQHHIVTDQTSVRRFFELLGESYSHIIRYGAEKDDGDEAASYAAWARWKAGQLQRTAAGSTAQGRFWKDKLAAAPRRSPFPPRLGADDGECGKGDDTAPGHVSFTVYPPAGKAGAAAPRPMEHFLAAVAAALGRRAGTDDVVVAVPFIDRLEPGTERILGLFLDRLPVRVRLPAALAAGGGGVSADEAPGNHHPLRGPLHEAVAAARAELQAALSQALPGHCIADVVAGGRDPGRGTAAAEAGLFDVMLVYNRWDDRVAGDLRMRGVTSVRSAAPRAPGAKFPFLVEFSELEDGAVVGEIEYMPERVGPGSVVQIAAELKKMLRLLESA